MATYARDREEDHIDEFMYIFSIHVVCVLYVWHSGDVW